MIVSNTKVLKLFILDPCVCRFSMFVLLHEHLLHVTCFSALIEVIKNCTLLADVTDG